MNIWLVRLICVPLTSFLIVLLVIKFEGSDETDTLILKIVSAIVLIFVIGVWYREEMDR